MELKRVQVHMLPTEDKTSKIWFDNDTGKLLYDPVGVMNCTPQHLYFTTDEEIKEDDWYINTEEKNGVKNPFYEKLYRANKSIHTVNPNYIQNLRKIIATTDPKLHTNEIVEEDVHMYKKQLPQPSQDFIKAYCEQGGIDEVDVEYECHKVWDKRTEELLEKYFTLKLDLRGLITIHHIV